MTDNALTTADMLQALAESLDDILNGEPPREQTIGFVLLTFPFNGLAGARTNYVSNGKREDIIVALKEIVARFEGQAQIVGRA